MLKAALHYCILAYNALCILQQENWECLLKSLIEKSLKQYLARFANKNSSKLKVNF